MTTTFPASSALTPKARAPFSWWLWATALNGALVSDRPINDCPISKLSVSDRDDRHPGRDLYRGSHGPSGLHASASLAGGDRSEDGSNMLPHMVADPSAPL